MKQSLDIMSLILAVVLIILGATAHFFGGKDFPFFLVGAIAGMVLLLVWALRSLSSLKISPLFGFTLASFIGFAGSLEYLILRWSDYEMQILVIKVLISTICLIYLVLCCKSLFRLFKNYSPSGTKDGASEGLAFFFLYLVIVYGGMIIVRNFDQVRGFLQRI